MRPIPEKLKKELASLPQVCARKGEDCRGRITWEHAMVYAGSQINEKWAIIFLCWHHHLGSGLDKKWNQRFAVCRATEEDRKKYPRIKWTQYT